MFCNDLDSTFLISAAGAANLAFFTEHSPAEFERSQHYLKDEAGNDVDAAAEITPSRPKPWGVSIGAAIVVNIVTLI
jgi:hypothetical protein